MPKNPCYSEYRIFSRWADIWRFTSFLTKVAVERLLYINQGRVTLCPRPRHSPWPQLVFLVRASIRSTKSAWQTHSSQLKFWRHICWWRWHSSALEGRATKRKGRTGREQVPLRCPSLGAAPRGQVRWGVQHCVPLSFLLLLMYWPCLYSPA